MRFKKQPWFSSLLALGCLSICVLFASCKEASTAVATPRDSSFEPLFFDGTEVEDSDAQAQAKDPRFSFLSADHFGCVSINIASVAANEGLSNVNWQELESELTDMLGSNGEIKNIERVWVLFDESLFSLSLIHI